ncbi:hypothetical protein [Acidithiobacillus caldus]|uniref:hypothetical protein n=1 Tax=Acidithiobacillus caldus TaxID=33059 RepID=UPI001C07A052|nr:hypothetical protein [Acidithiobacillus caldus]MBU2762691.1 hypothetical protein [Acidithiobacillus caldus]MBU2769847.1 hypothetical protein [Acidithiobacillus caldus]
MPTHMLERNNIVNGFVLVNDEATKKALAAAKEEVGEAAWKQGYSEEREKIARAMLKEHGARYETVLSGYPEKVEIVQNNANGAVLDKVRVTLGQVNGDKYILSENLNNNDFSQGLLAKLDSVEPGQKITIGGFVSPRENEKDGKTYFNHIAFVKDEFGQEIRDKKEHFKKVKEMVKTAKESMQGFENNKTVMKNVENSVKLNYFKELGNQMSRRFSPPRLEAHTQTQEGTWHSTSLYVDQDGKPKGTLIVENKDAGIREVHPVEYKERESKAGNPMLSASVTREDGSKLYVNIVPNENQHTGERYLSAMFAQKTPDMEKAQTIEGRGGSLKANETMLKQGEQNRTVQYVQDRFAVNPLENSRGQDKAKEAQAVAMGR